MTHTPFYTHAAADLWGFCSVSFAALPLIGSMCFTEKALCVLLGFCEVCDALLCKL